MTMFARLVQEVDLLDLRKLKQRRHSVTLTTSVEVNKGAGSYYGAFKKILERNARAVVTNERAREPSQVVLLKVAGGQRVYLAGYEVVGRRVESKAGAVHVVDMKAANLKSRRDQALDATFGLLKGKGVLPEDALQFEREMREE